MFDNGKIKVNIGKFGLKVFTILCSFLIIINMFSITCHAFKSSPGLNVRIADKASLENIAYIDLLLPIESFDSISNNVIEKSVNSFSGKEFVITRQCEITKKQIISGHEYYSFLYYFPFANVETFVSDEYLFIYDGEKEDNLINILKDADRLYLAFVNENGDIVSLTNDFKLNNNWFTILYSINIDGMVVSNETSINYFTLIPFVVLFVGSFIICLIVTRKIISNKHNN